MPRGQEISKELVHEALTRAGYTDVRYSDQQADTILGRYEGRGSIHIRVRPDLNLLTFMHFWGMKGKEKDILSALNKANGMSYYDTFARDNDGDLWVSSYMVITESVSADDVIAFLEKEADQFRVVVATSGLLNYVQ